MFRENVLTDDEIIDLISTTMIPVAVDRWKVEDPNTREAQFLQPFLKRHPPQGSPCIYAPDGRVLGGFDGFDDMARRTKALISESLKAFGPVTRRAIEPIDTHPHRGQGVMPNGQVTLAEYIRPSEEALAFLNTKSPVISSLTLSEKEFQAFAPQKLVVGSKWKLPDAVARRFSRVTSPLCYQHAPQPEWVTAVRMNAEVLAIQNGIARLRYEVHLASEHAVARQKISLQQAQLSGEGIYDLESRTMQSFVLVGTGDLRWPEAPDKLVTFDVLVEWTGSAP